MDLLITSHNVPAEPGGASEDACAGTRLAEGALAIVCDGVGSARGGGEAAQRVVRHFVEAVPLRPRLWTPTQTLTDLATQMNAMLHEESHSRYGRPELICTLAVVMVTGDHLFGINSGDTMVFLFRDGRIRELSTRHAGTSAEDAHVLTQALGLGPDFSGSSFQVQLRADDLVLVCSDGVTDGLDQADLTDLCARRVGARSIVAAARERVLERGDDPDDISAVVLEVQRGAGKLESELHLFVPGAMKAGDSLAGWTLERAFVDTGRVWKVRKHGGQEAVFKLAPEEARGDEQIKAAFAREIWHALRVRNEFMPRAWLPEGTQVPGYLLDYVAGPTLEEIFKAGSLSLEEVVALARFLVAAGQGLAELDLLHGDLKPENVVVLGRAEKIAFKLIDYGSMARPFALVKRAGTASYLAPERFNNAGITESTELFAIGVILFRALVGKFPFGEIERFQTPRFEEGAKGPSRTNGLVPLWLDAVVQRCLAIDPELRYSYFSELRFDLENPDKVAPFRLADTPMIERNPLKFFKILSLVFFLIILLQAWWISRH